MTINLDARGSDQAQASFDASLQRAMPQLRAIFRGDAAASELDSPLTTLPRSSKERDDGVYRSNCLTKPT